MLVTSCDSLKYPRYTAIKVIIQKHPVAYSATSFESHRLFSGDAHDFLGQSEHVHVQENNWRLLVAKEVSSFPFSTHTILLNCYRSVHRRLSFKRGCLADLRGGSQADISVSVYHITMPHKLQRSFRVEQNDGTLMYRILQKTGWRPL